MNKLVFCFVVLCLVSFMMSGAGFSAEKGLYTEYILDASNSMNEPLPSGEIKIDVAKRVICNLIDNIAAEAEGNVNVGLRVYGAGFDPSGTKEKACQDSVLEIPIKGIQADLIKQTVRNIEAKGFTPIAYSLELASKDFPEGEETNNVMILVSDGKESCGGDPAGVIKKLKEQGFKVVVHCIGFAVDEDARKQLESIAKISGGLYYSAANADQLSEYMKKVTERAFEEYEAAGEKIDAGRLISLAPEIEAGDYKDKIAMQEVKFYKLKVYKGQTVKAILVVKKTPYDAMNSNINQTFSVKLFNEDLDEVSSADYKVTGNPSAPVTFKAQWEADRTGWVYAAVCASRNHNADGDPVSLYPEGLRPEPSAYTLKIKIQGEIPAVEEAGEFGVSSVKEKRGGKGFADADQIETDSFYNGEIYLKELRYYKVPVGKGAQKISVKAVVAKPWYNAMNSNIAMEYTLKVYDEDWIEVASNGVIIEKNPAGPFCLSVECDIGGNSEMYIALAASNNFNIQNKSGVSLYPEDFIPESQGYSIFVSEK